MILGVIPARGGSKGIPRKNLKELNGKPLILWSIEAARKSELLDRFIVSTEDREIAAVSRRYGADVQMRSPHLSTDSATTLAVLQYILKRIPSDVVVLLQPTSPLRPPIDDAIREFLNRDCDTLATGYYTTHGPWTGLHKPRQEQTPYFHDDGNIYIFAADVIREGRWKGDKPYEMEIPSQYNIEIDNISDFWAIEGIMNHVLA